MCFQYHYSLACRHICTHHPDVEECYGMRTTGVCENRLCGVVTVPYRWEKFICLDCRTMDDMRDLEGEVLTWSDVPYTYLGGDIREHYAVRC